MRNKFDYIQSPIFSSDQVAHGFFGRKGGVSSEPYSSLNVAYGRQDNESNVTVNRELIASAIGLADENRNLITVSQAHGSECLYVGDATDDIKAQQADALVTDQSRLAITILTADCVPVLFKGHKEDGSLVIGAAHAGWRGAIGGVLQSTIKAMKDLGAIEISGTVGPCIGASSYEVGHEFREEFITEHQDNTQFFVPSKNHGHHMFDIAGYVKEQLAKQAITKIDDVSEDTYRLTDKYFSHRRACHEDLEDTGRQASVIMIL